jgi:hypothetical protein
MFKAMFETKTNITRIQTKGGVKMIDKIDVRDLPEEQVKLIQEFVEFLRAKLRTKQFIKEEKGVDEEWSKLAIDSFAEDWDNEKDAIYDNWKELYGVSER